MCIALGQRKTGLTDNRGSRYLDFKEAKKEVKLTERSQSTNYISHETRAMFRDSAGQLTVSRPGMRYTFR